MKVVFYKHPHIFVFVLQPNKTTQLVSETEASTGVQSHIFIYNLQILDTYWFRFYICLSGWDWGLF